METRCSVCLDFIPQERLEAVPETDTCVKCSKVEKTQGVLEFGHKTAGTIVLLPKDPEQRRLVLRAHKRSR